MSIQKKILGAAPYLQSSEDPEKVSRTLTSLLPLISLILATFKLDIPQTEIETYVLAVASVINGGITLKFGLQRAINWWKQR